MNRYYPHRQLCSLMLLLIFVASCNNGQDKTKDKVNEPKTIPASQSKIVTSVHDPYFVETLDTISAYGPRSITRNILQDKNGNMWFATWQGIMRYDGTLFTNFTLKAGLIKFHVFSVLEDKSGNLWFGTIRGGVYRYDGKSFTLFTTADGLADDMVLCMLDDNAGNIWFGTDNGVSRYNGKTFTNFSSQDGLSGNSVNSIAQDKTGKLWFGTRGGVSFYDAKSLPAGKVGFVDFSDLVLKSFYNVRSVIEDKNGNIWIGSEDGLFRYDPAASTASGKKSLTIITSNFTGYIFEDKAGNLWLSENDPNGGGMTLTRYDGRSFTKVLKKNEFSRASVGNQIFGSYEDRTGNIWFGTVNGVYRYDGKSFSNFTEQE